MSNTSVNQETTNNINSNDRATGFNILALLFPTSYYAGYGKVQQSLFMSLVGFMPLTMIIVGIYSGLNANKEISERKIENFNWPAAIGIAMINLFIGILAMASIAVINA